MRLALALLFLVHSARAGGTDLRKVYKATLDHEAGSFSLEWTCEPEDVWDLESFGYEVAGQFEIALGPSTVTFGKHGTNVLWAVVVPKEAGRLRSMEGGEEQVASVWIRLHPVCVGDLFPRKTVRENGDPRAIYWAKRVYWARINDSWQAEAAPVVPTRDSVVIDIDTTEGRRHMYAVDTRNRSAKHYGGTAVPAPPRTPMARAEAVRAFEEAWAEFDRTYAKFEIRRDVDWDKLRARYLPLAESSTTAWEAANAIALLLAHLRDLHIWVSVGEEGVPVYYRPRLLNANWKATQALLGGTVTDTGRDLHWGRTGDGIGYISVMRLSDRRVVGAFEEALERLADTWGLIIDLRFNGGGGEDLALEMAGRIVDEERVYSVNRYRSGPRRSQLGARLDRRILPRGSWRYGAPVVVLTGQKTFSSAESFALMLAVCPHVTSMGDRTGGSSANPTRKELPGRIVVNVPRWHDMTPDGNPIEDRGVEPEVAVEGGLNDFESGDPVVEAALKKLRKTPKSRRRPGRRNA